MYLIATHQLSWSENPTIAPYIRFAKRNNKSKGDTRIPITRLHVMKMVDHVYNNILFPIETKQVSAISSLQKTLKVP